MLSRILLGASAAALVGAWLAALSAGSLLGLSEQHLFFDSIALSLLGIGVGQLQRNETTRRTT